MLTTEPFVVVGRKGSAGKPTFAPDGGWVIDTAYYAQPRSDDLLCKFLYYALESCDFSQDVIATAIPGINRTAIYQHEADEVYRLAWPALAAFCSSSEIFGAIVLVVYHIGPVTYMQRPGGFRVRLV